MNGWLDYFDRVVCINLDRRLDRWHRFQESLAACGWPFGPPERVRGIDGTVCGHPPGITAGTWGCLQSHRRVLEDALLDGACRVLVLEDDAVFHPRFGEQVTAFLERVPADWDGLMLGGQHRRSPQRLAPGVVRCAKTERTHCYAVCGRYTRALYARLLDGLGHCDQLMSTLHGAYRVFAPERFLVAQGEGRSDIAGRTDPERWWNT